MGDGDVLWAWQAEDRPGHWSTILAIGVGVHAGLAGMPLLHRKREVAMQMEAVACKHGDTLKQHVRLARFEMTEIEAEHRP